MGKLTEPLIQAWINEGVPIAGRSDGGGLTFTLSRAGMAAWVLRYRIAGEPKELTLGRYPQLTLAGARAKADDERERIALGWDVASEKAAKCRAGRTHSKLMALESELSRCERMLATLSERLTALRSELKHEQESGRYGQAD